VHYVGEATPLSLATRRKNCNAGARAGQVVVLVLVTFAEADLIGWQ